MKLVRLGYASWVLVLLLAGFSGRAGAHIIEPSNECSPNGALHELRITRLTSLSVAQAVNQRIICAFPNICFQNEIHLPVLIDFETGEICIDATTVRDENGTPNVRMLFNTQAGPGEMRLETPCVNPDGCFGGTPVYIGTIDESGNIFFESIGLTFELFATPPFSIFTDIMSTGVTTNVTDPSVMGVGTPLDFTTGEFVLEGIEFLPAPIIGNGLILPRIEARIFPPPVPPLDASSLLRCEKTLRSQAGSFAKRKQRDLTKCVDALLACELDTETGAGAKPGCISKAIQLCDKSAEKIKKAETTLDDKILRTCDDVGAANLVSAIAGLGFGNNLNECVAQGVGGTSKEDLVACIVRRLECSVEQAVGTLSPRANEVLAANGFDQFLPDPNSGGCVPPLGSGDASGADRKRIGKCQKDVNKQGALLVKTKQKDLGKCVGDMLACEIKETNAGIFAYDLYQWEQDATEDQVNNAGTPDGSTDSAATGHASISYDPASDLLSYTISWNNLEGLLTALHVHGPATPAESTVPHLWNVYTAESDVIAAGVNRTTDSVTFSAPLADIMAASGAPFTVDAVVNFMEQELGYVNIHSSLFPMGEIRANLQLDVANSVPSSCRAKAIRNCEKGLEKIDKRIVQFGEKIEKSCGPDFDSDLAQGLGFEGLETTCGPIANLAELIACLESTLDCTAEGMVRTADPRAAEMLEDLLDRFEGPDLLSQFDCLNAVCSNAYVDLGENCDPFLPDPDCDGSCTLAECGNNTVEGLEECDDGNLLPGDGCDENCAVEPSQCGNGVLELGGGEICDPDNDPNDPNSAVGDTHGGDGCSADCLSDESCGNGVVDTLLGEVCDDGGSLFAVNLDGSQEVPPVATAATASASFALDPNDRLDYSVTTSGLVDGTAAHIHPGFAGENGGILIPLTGGPTDWSGTTRPLTAIEIARLKAGGFYVNVHTLANPGGELRGQMAFASAQDGDGCSADCLSDETCGNGVIDTVTGESCDDGNTSGGDGCDASCQFEACGFFSSGAPLGVRNFSIDPNTGAQENSLLAGFAIGTVALTSGDLELNASATDATGTANITLDSDLIVAVDIPLGGLIRCIRFEATGSAGTLHCCGGHAVGVDVVRDSNAGGTGGNGPTLINSPLGEGGVGDLLMSFQVSERNLPRSTNDPNDCLTTTFFGPSTQVWTTGLATGRVLNSEQGGDFTFTGSLASGQAFDCSNWTSTNGVGAFERSEINLNALPGQDGASKLYIDDQSGD